MNPRTAGQWRWKTGNVSDARRLVDKPWSYCNVFEQLGKQPGVLGTEFEAVHLALEAAAADGASGVAR